MGMIGLYSALFNQSAFRNDIERNRSSTFRFESCPHEKVVVRRDGEEARGKRGLVWRIFPGRGGRGGGGGEGHFIRLFDIGSKIKSELPYKNDKH